MGDLISIKKRTAIKRAANWRSLASSETMHQDRITMTQEAVWNVFQRVVSADNPEQAIEYLTASLPTRRHLTYWLGQTGHRLDVRLGRNRNFSEYLAEVAARLWERSHNEYHQSFWELKGGTMKTKKEKSHRAAKATTDKQKMTEAYGNEAAGKDVSQAASVEPKQVETVTDESKPSPAPQIGRIQQYWISTMLVFADCAVQNNPDGVFDVLARNFDSPGALSWWLYRIGRGEMAKYTKGKDVVDAIRKVAHELHRELREIGKPVARH